MFGFWHFGSDFVREMVETRLRRRIIEELEKLKQEDIRSRRVI